jgi:hypothetical protein
MHCCSTHQCSKLYTHCRHCSPYTDQKTANRKIKSELQKILKTDLHTITCRAKQAHIKRRQEYDPTRGEGQQNKKRRTVGEMGNLQNFPCLTEEMFCCYACPVPEERPHRIQMAGIENSGFPEQLISLPNPNLLEPLVTFETKKLIFSPDGDGNARTRDERISLEKADIQNKQMIPVSMMGRDESFLRNLLWLCGGSQVVLWGVGNGMLPWVCLHMRIPILCIFENELHKDTIQKHILDKIEKVMDDPADKRFYKTDGELGVTTEEPAKTAGAGGKTQPKGKPQTGPVKDKPVEEPSESENSSSSQSPSSSSEKKTKKTKKEDKKDDKKDDIVKKVKKPKKE